MSRLFKERRKEGPNVEPSSPSQNATASTSTSITTDQSSVAIEKVDWVLHIAGIIKDISEGSQLLAPLKATCALIIRGLEITRDTLHNAPEWNAIAESLERQNDIVQTFVDNLQQGNKRANAGLQSACQTYLTVLQEVLTEATKPVKPLKQSVPKRLRSMLHSVPVANSTDSIVSLKQKMDAAFEDFFASALLDMSLDVAEFTSLATELHEQVVEKIGELRLEDPAEEEYEDHSLSRLFYGLDIPLCLPGTRIDLLDNIHQWSRQTLVKEQIYWLKDAAGTGKTTVAATLAQDWMLEKRLAGRFFFTPNSIFSSGIGQFCIALAKDIAKQIPLLEPTILQALKDFPHTHYGFHPQFQNLIIEPLRSLEPAAPILLVIDALDNCDPDGREELLNCILENLSSVSHVKLLITSRPSADIVSILWDSDLVRGREVQLLDINDTVLADIRAYIGSTLITFSAEQCEQLVGYSGGLFIVAATACKLLRWNAEPAQLLSKLLHADKKDQLDELYLEVLRQAVSDPTAHEMMMNVLQIIIVAFQPVSINTIRTFLPSNIEVDAFVQDLGAVLKDGNPDRPIKVLHPTFREFLAEEERANGFLVNTLSSHALTAIGCLGALENALEYDMLRLHKKAGVKPRNADVEDLDRKVMTATTAAVRYAASYWTYHVAACLEDIDIWFKALHFLSTKLLNWIEVMSWRGMLGDCAQGLSQLRIGASKALHKGDNTLAAKVSHAYQFLLQHQPMLQDSALHTYSSALAFTPSGSPLLEVYRRKHESQMPRIISTTPITWSMRDILAGHSGSVRQLEFSSDGSRLATRSEDRSLILWDATSGAIIRRWLGEGAEDKVESLAFSPDGQILSFITKSARVYSWHSSTGKGHPSFICPGSGEAVQLAFSPIHPYIISASKESHPTNWEADNNITVWDLWSGRKLGHLLLDGGARCFSISPDGSRIVCVSRVRLGGEFAGSVTLWDLESLVQLAEYEMQIRADIFCVSYSSKGDRFVTWDLHGTLYLRNGISGDEIRLIKDARRALQGVHFAPVGNLMASFYRKKEPVILLWDSETGEQKLSLCGHTGSIIYVSFTQDGLRLASVSLDQTIRVWDTITGNNLESIFTGYTGRISHPLLSRDWSKLVTVSTNHQINLHVVSAGTMHGTEVYEETALNLAAPNVAVSPNGDVMVCGFMDLGDRSTLELWSLETCAQIGVPMVGHRGGIISVAFSCDAKYASSLSADGTMRVWDASTGLPIGDPFPMDDGYYVTFSPDSRLIGCSSYRAIKVWDIHTRVVVLQLEHGGSSDRITFSPDSSRLAGGLDGNICVWNLIAGPSASPKVTSSTATRFDELVFSPTDEIMASRSTSSIYLWKIADKIHLISKVSTTPVEGFRLGISSDGNFLAYGSSVWNLASLPDAPIPLHAKGADAPLLEWKVFPYSFLTYHDGWIHSAAPWGPLVPIPRHLWDRFRHWHAYGYKIIIWTQERRPVVIDCEQLVVGSDAS